MCSTREQEKLSIREQEKLCFMRAFDSYMIPFMKNSKEQKVIIRKDASMTVRFEFTEENNVTTVRSFPDDLIFAYQIAVDAIYDSTKCEKPNLSIQVYEDYAEVTLL